jgi:hypothetical protein
MFTLTATDAYTYSENPKDQALWGDVIFASRPNGSTMSTQSGDPNVVRKSFTANGTLTGALPNWKKGGVVGISHDLGAVKGNASVTFAVGYVRQQAINYMGNPYTGYYRKRHPSTLSAVSYFLEDYDDAKAESLRMDYEISCKAIQVAGQKH